MNIIDTPFKLEEFGGKVTDDHSISGVLHAVKLDEAIDGGSRQSLIIRELPISPAMFKRHHLKIGDEIVGVYGMESSQKPAIVFLTFINP